MSQGVENWERRDCFAQLEDFLYSTERDRVCLIFGLRRTGKTTMLRQAIGEMSREDLARAAYLKSLPELDMIDTQEADVRSIGPVMGENVKTKNNKSQR